MEQRPRSTIGLAAHLVRLRWQQLSARGRMIAGVALAVAALAGLAGAHRALGGACCAGSCPAARARLEAEPVAAADAVDVSEAGGAETDPAEAPHEGCAGAH